MYTRLTRMCLRVRSAYRRGCPRDQRDTEQVTGIPMAKNRKIPDDLTGDHFRGHCRLCVRLFCGEFGFSFAEFARVLDGTASQAMYNIFFEYPPPRAIGAFLSGSGTCCFRLLSAGGCSKTRWRIHLCWAFPRARRWERRLP